LTNYQIDGTINLVEVQKQT